MVLSSCSSHFSTTLSPGRGVPYVSTGQAGPLAAPAGGLWVVTVATVATTRAVTTTVVFASLCFMDSSSLRGAVCVAGRRHERGDSTPQDERGECARHRSAVQGPRRLKTAKSAMNEPGTQRAPLRKYGRPEKRYWAPPSTGARSVPGPDSRSCVEASPR